VGNITENIFQKSHFFFDIWSCLELYLCHHLGNERDKDKIINKQDKIEKQKTKKAPEENLLGGFFVA